MARKNKLMRSLISLLKDKASLLKAALSLPRATSSIHVTVLKATPHSRSSSPPRPHRLAAVLLLGRGPRPTAAACISALMDRLHATKSAHVALKCLVAVHHVIANGSFILRDQLSLCPRKGGRNSLKLSQFNCDSCSDVLTWQLSRWAKWYACYMENNLISSRILGTFISSENNNNECGNNNYASLMNWELTREVETLVAMIEEICKAPDTMCGEQGKCLLVYEILKLVNEDYGKIQRHVWGRLGEFRDRVSELTRTELDELMSLLRRTEKCRERLLEMFGNKKRNDAFWDFLGEITAEAKKASESTRFQRRVSEPSRVLRLTYVTVGPAVV